MAYVVFTTRIKPRLYLGKDGAFWKDRKRAKKFATEREAGLAVKRYVVPTDYEPEKEPRDGA